MSHFTVNYMDMRYLATLLARGPQAMSSITRMSSQLYMPHYLVIRSAAPCKAPVQRRRAAILRRRGQSQPGVDYWAVGSGAGAVASPVVRSGSHFSPAF